MANRQHLSLLKDSIANWNNWRDENPDITPDLSSADLSRTDLRAAKLRSTKLVRADLHDANLSGNDLSNVNLSEANLNGANLSGVSLIRANLSDAVLSKANLSGTNLMWANLVEADLRDTNLMYSQLVETNFSNANLTGCQVYGVSAWNINLSGAIQSNLVITPVYEATITVDNLKVAQFVYLLLNNAEIRDVVDSLTSKIVLILGRFTPERKAALNIIREELRGHNYLPVLFDFERPSSRNLTESILTLASLARFIIVDITDSKSITQELSVIIPTLAVPVQPIQEKAKAEYSMFSHFGKYPWVLPVFQYGDIDDLLASLKEKIITPAEVQASQLEKIKAQQFTR